MPEAVIVNGLNKTAILDVIGKMKADSTLGSRSTVVVNAEWDEGVVTNPGLGLVCYGPSELLTAEQEAYLNENPKPTMRSWCPLAAVGCYSYVFMLQAALRDLQLDKFTTVARANWHLPCLFHSRERGRCPWEEIHLEINVEGATNEETVAELERLAQRHCPSVELMREEVYLETKVESTVMDDKFTDVPPLYYNVERYKEISAQRQGEEDFKELVGRAVWYCHSECQEYPGCMIQLFEEDSRANIPLSYKAPIASGKYANPVQACFFGGMAVHMHTVAILLAVKGYAVRDMTATISAQMNERKIMGVEERTWVFPEGIKIEIELESNAPRDIVQKIAKRAEEMSPSFVGWTTPIRLLPKLNVVQK